MIFTPISTAEIPRAWEALSAAIEPAVRADPNQTMQGEYARLVAGIDLAVMISGADGYGALILQCTEQGECWIRYLAGRMNGGPKAKLRALREGMAWVEKAAAEAGCGSVKVCGRDWSMVLTEYELMSGFPNGLRKALDMKEAA
jgi:hypothetical protein